jgi:pimeloyl-ACP methyl ester carboxylesterase
MKLKTNFIITLLVSASVIGACSQSPDVNREQNINPELSQAIEEHYQAWIFDTLDLGGDDFVSYGALVRDGEQGKRPLLVFLDGSGYQSVFGLKENDAWVRPGSPFGFGTSLFPEYDLLIPEKVNVIIGGDHREDDDMLRRYTLDDRVESAAKVIDTFLDGSAYDTVFIFGVSEGGMILPQVYQRLENKEKVGKLIISGAGGLSQAEEFEILRHYDNLPDSLKGGYEQFDLVIAEINGDPDSIEKEYFGHPFKRWSTFLDYRPLDDLVLVEIPILLIHGTEDVSSPVETARIVVDEFAALEKTNLTYHEYEGMGHGPSSKEEQDKIYTALREWLDHDMPL